MPHGYCFFWNPILVSLHVISDGLIALAYASIPMTLLYIVAKRKDLPFNWMFLWFGTFIVSCGITHVMSIVTLWYAWYWSAGIIKMITAIASLGTAYLLIRLLPNILTFPSRDELLQVNDSLAKAEGKFRDLLEGVPDALVIVDPNENITMVNDVTLKMFGFNKEELIGTSLSNLLPAFHLPKSFKSGTGIEQIAINKTLSPFPVEVSLSPVKTLEGNLMLITIRDITERKRVDKMKDEFISVVSHELRTPLTSIHGSIELLAEGKIHTFPSNVKMLLNIAKNNSMRLIRLINDILDIEKIESGNMHFDYKKIDLNALAEEAVKINESYCHKYGASIKLTRYSAPVIVKSDQDRIMQSLTNLISNAAKFANKSEIKVVVKKTHKNARIEVIDQGIGIKEAFKPNIFKKFTQEDSSDTREHAGTGLGLHITKTLIDKLGGNIGFESTENIGTMFYIELPLALEEETEHV